MFSWFALTFPIISHWLIILIAVERFICVWYYSQAKKIYTTKVAAISVTIICGAAAVFVGMWVGIRYTAAGSCVPPATALSGTAYRVVSVLSLLLYFAVPLPLLAVLNVLIAGKLWQQHATGSSQMKWSNFTAMLMAIIMLFLVLINIILTAILLGRPGVPSTNGMPAQGQSQGQWKHN